MADDPSNWELARRLDQIYGSLQALIGRAEYTEYQRSIEHRLTEIQRDISDVRAWARAELDEVRKAHNEYVDKSSANRQWRTLVYTGLIPSLVAIAGILVTLAIHSGGG